jgi:hypothetical protein
MTAGIPPLTAEDQALLETIHAKVVAEAKHARDTGVIPDADGIAQTARAVVSQLPGAEVDLLAWLYVQLVYIENMGLRPQVEIRGQRHTVWLM